MIQKLIRKERRRNNDCHNPQGFKQLRSFDTIIHLGKIFTLVGVPLQIERGIANHIIKAHIGIIIANVTMFQIGGWIEIVGNFM